MVGFRKENQETATRILSEAIDLGVNFVDTADCYGESEEVVGKGLAELGKRDKVVLAIKFGWYMGPGANDYGASRSHIINACDDSLRKLRTDYIDLYILHVVDPNTPWDETMRALDALVQQGKVRYLGTSKHPMLLIMESLWASERYGLERLVSEQPPYNILDRQAENELIPGCIRHGIGITPFFPLASGLLSGKYRAGKAAPEGGRLSGRGAGASETFAEGALKVVEQLVPIADEVGVTMAELALAWLMHQPGVTSPILGARTVEYLRSGVKACELELGSETLAKIDGIVPPGTAVSNYFAGNTYHPLRMAYSSAARALPGTGAYIPVHATGSGPRAGR